MRTSFAKPAALLTCILALGSWNTLWAQAVVTKEPVLESDKPDAGKNKIELPKLEEGPGKGFFVFLDKPKFRFTVNASGGCVMQLKDDAGQLLKNAKFELGGNIATGWRKPTHYDAKKRIVYRGVTRHMVSMSGNVQATYQPTKIFIQAKLMDNVDFNWSLTAQMDGVELECGFKCPNRSYPSHAGFGTKFPATKGFAPQVDLNARKEALRNWTLKFDSSKSKKRDFFFYENAKLPEYAKRMEVFGPWERRRFILSTTTGSETLRPSMYAGNCPHQGFGLGIAQIPNNSIGKLVGFKISVQ